MKQTVKIVIVEDEESAVSRLKKELSRLENFDFEVLASLGAVSDAVKWFQNHANYDLIFMDVQLSDGISFNIFKKITPAAPVIFTTAYDEYALQAFKVNSIDYLLKPVNPAELRSAIKQYKEAAPSENMNQVMQMISDLKPEKYRSSFLVSYRHKMIMIDVQDVAFIYIKEKGVFLRRKDNTEYLVDFFLDELESQLNPSQFYRANRQFLIARSSIVEIEPYLNGRLILKMNPASDTPVTISKEKATDFKRWADY